jgi:hypothetical protein
MMAKAQSHVVPLKLLSEKVSHLEGGTDTESPSKTTLTNCLLGISFTCIDVQKSFSLPGNTFDEVKPVAQVGKVEA